MIFFSRSILNHHGLQTVTILFITTLKEWLFFHEWRSKSSLSWRSDVFFHHDLQPVILFHELRSKSSLALKSDVFFHHDLQPVIFFTSWGQNYHWLERVMISFIMGNYLWPFIQGSLSANTQVIFHVHKFESCSPLTFLVHGVTSMGARSFFMSIDLNLAPLWLSLYMVLQAWVQGHFSCP